MNIIGRSSRLGFYALCIAALQACNGTSGENGDDPFGDGNPTAPVVTSISVSVLNASCTASTNRAVIGEQLCIQARLTQDNIALSDQIVQFTTTLGEFDVASRLTNAQGVAQVSLLSQDATLGAGQIQVSFSAASGAVNNSANFEFLSNAVPVAEPTQIELTTLDNNNAPANRVASNNTLRLSATLFDTSNQPIANQIIQFQSTLGTVSPESALTNTQGVAVSSFIPDERLGAGTLSATANVNNVPVAISQNIEVLAADVVNTDTVRLGIFENGTFIEGLLGIDSVDNNQEAAISAGGTIGLNVALADSNGQPITSALPVSFSSTCVSAGDAIIDDTVLAVNGIARSTYQDLSCAGANGNDDVIRANITVNGQQIEVSRLLSLQGEAVGSIRFISAQPNNIVLAGSGGQDAQTVSTVTFAVDGTLGNPLAQQNVSFALNSTIGGLTLSPTEGLTNSQGQVSTRVTAGSVPTAVRVTASVNVQADTQIQSQSELLTVNTGLPDQNSISLAPDNLNPEAFNILGATVQITARLADSFNNPVPDGTAVSFVSEGGSIEPSCTTLNGACSVTWTSSEPRATDHRVTILATAIGHETLFDSNGNNQYDTSDGAAFTGESGNGLDTFIATTTGFSDLPEAWLDNNEDGLLNGAEIFLDFNSSGSFDEANNLFDGPQCADSCAASSLHVRRAVVLVTSSSAALMSFSNNGIELGNNSQAAPTAPTLSLARGASTAIVLTYSDTAGQPIASESTIDIASSAGSLSGATQSVMPRTNNPALRTQTMIINNNLLPTDTSVDATLTATIVSPSGVTSTLSIIITLE